MNRENIQNFIKRRSIVSYILPVVFIGVGIALAVISSLPLGVIVGAAGLAIGAIEYARYEMKTNFMTTAINK